MGSVKIILILIVLTALLAPVLCQAEGKPCQANGFNIPGTICKTECDIVSGIGICNAELKCCILF